MDKITQIRERTTSSDSLVPKRFMLRVYQDVDRVIADELKRLRTLKGIEPPCRKGCAHCCRQGIPVTLPEVRVVADYIRRVFSPSQRRALRESLREQLRGLGNAARGHSAAIYEHAPPCVLLENGICSVYLARPAICRIHYVNSDPRTCMPKTNPEALPEPPLVLESFHMRTGLHIQRIRDYVKQMGLEFGDSVSSFPRWLAEELGWSELLLPNSPTGPPDAAS